MRRALLAVVAACGAAAPAAGQPPFGPPGWRGGFGYHPVFGYGFAHGPYARGVWVVPLAPPPVVVRLPVIVVGGSVPVGPAEAVQPAGGDLPPGAKPGDFLVIRPGGKGPTDGKVVPEIDRIIPPPLPEPSAPVPAPVERPEADAAAESARQVRLAKASFAAEEYAAAVDHLTRAIRAKPDDALPHFLLGQVRFASGRYTDAVAAIESGLKLAPHWPLHDFRPRDLYGPHPERFDDHLATLRKAASARPADAGLTFLLGYQLWFGGDRPAAVEQFKRAAGRAPETAGAFLRAAKGD
jgi:hypothetical protein